MIAGRLMWEGLKVALGIALVVPLLLAVGFDVVLFTPWQDLSILLPHMEDLDDADAACDQPLQLLIMVFWTSVVVKAFGFVLAAAVGTCCGGRFLGCVKMLVKPLVTLPLMVVDMAWPFCALFCFCQADRCADAVLDETRVLFSLYVTAFLCWVVYSFWPLLTQRQAGSGSDRVFLFGAMAIGLAALFALAATMTLVATMVRTVFSVLVVSCAFPALAAVVAHTDRERRRTAAISQRLARVPYAPELFGDDLPDGYPGSCPICCEDFAAGQDIVATPCPAGQRGHIFHRPCIARWACVAPTCPLCRWPLGETSAVSLELTAAG